jgi:hypothetical protein
MTTARQIVLSVVLVLQYPIRRGGNNHFGLTDALNAAVDDATARNGCVDVRRNSAGKASSYFRII